MSLRPGLRDVYFHFLTVTVTISVKNVTEIIVSIVCTMKRQISITSFFGGETQGDKKKQPRSNPPESEDNVTRASTVSVAATAIAAGEVSVPSTAVVPGQTLPSVTDPRYGKKY